MKTVYLIVGPVEPHGIEDGWSDEFKEHPTPGGEVFTKGRKYTVESIYEDLSAGQGEDKKVYRMRVKY